MIASNDETNAGSYSCQTASRAATVANIVIDIISINTVCTGWMKSVDKSH